MLTPILTQTLHPNRRKRRTAHLHHRQRRARKRHDEEAVRRAIRAADGCSESTMSMMKSEASTIATLKARHTMESTETRINRGKNETDSPKRTTSLASSIRLNEQAGEKNPQLTRQLHRNGSILYLVPFIRSYQCLDARCSIENT
jgi:hypothetical protein